MLQVNNDDLSSMDSPLVYLKAHSVSEYKGSASSKLLIKL